MSIAEQIVADAWAAFDQWCREHDPEGDMDALERVEAYGKWCDAGNRVVLSSTMERKP